MPTNKSVYLLLLFLIWQVSFVTANFTAICYSSIDGFTGTLFDNVTVPGCPPRFYCPNSTASDNTTLPRSCPPSTSCAASRFSGNFCEPQGNLEPEPCPKGFYCPTTSTMQICPAGSFCPVGTENAIPCGVMSLCPQGSDSRGYYGGIVFCIIIDLLLFLSYRIVRYYGDKTVAKAIQVNPTLASDPNKTAPASATSEAGPSSVAFTRTFQDGAPIVRSGSNAGTYLEVLMNSFRKGMLNRTVKMHFSFSNLQYKLPNGKVILQDVTGDILPGRVTAIMGPSGAGKTSLMSVLLGKVKRTSGNFYVNGVETEMSHFKNLIGYVPQEDIMIPELTVRENVAHSAHCRLPDVWTREEKEKHIDSVLAALDLGHVAYTLIGDTGTRGISGGQKKRVNVGLELAAVPLVLMLDEPTSGLDSAASVALVNNLKLIASIGLTVVSVIHQPRYEIFQTFDDVMLLATGGHTAYWGPQDQVVPYFKSLGFRFHPLLNPADVLMDILSGKGDFEKAPTYDLEKDVLDPWKQFQTTHQHQTVPSTRDRDAIALEKDLSDIAEHRGASLWKQVYQCHQRACIQQYRSFFSFGLELFVAFFAGLLIGVSAMGQNGTLYRGQLIEPYTLISPEPLEWFVLLMGTMICLAVSLAGGPPGVQIFGEEKPIYFREASSGHSRFAYFLGKVLAFNYRVLLTSLHFVSVLYFFAKPQMNFWDMYGVVFMAFFCVYGISMSVSWIVPRENGPLMAVISSSIFGVFSGFGPTLRQARDWKLDFIWALSFSRWANEAIYGRELVNFEGLYEIDTVSAVEYGLELRQYGLDLAIMFIIGVIWRILAFVLMVNTNKRKQQ